MRGALIHGKYLLIDRLHPPPFVSGGPPSSHNGSGNGREEQQQVLGHPPLQHSISLQQLQGLLPLHLVAGRYCCSSPNHTWAQGAMWSVSSVFQDAPFSLWLPAQPLLLPPTKATAAVSVSAATAAAAVVSVRAERALAKRRSGKSEGFCIDPYM